MIGRRLDRYGAGRHFHSSKDPAAIFAQPTIVHQRLPHLHRFDLPLGLERPIPGHVSANVQCRGGYAWSRADHSLEYLTVRILPTSAIRRHICVLVRTVVGELALLTFFWRLFDSVRTQVRPFWWVMCSVTIAT